nr:hypothetical protein [Tanacetum cinerariifolium]
DPWSFKEEILLVDAIAANVSRAEKKKRCRVVCRTHGVGSAHHARWIIGPGLRLAVMKCGESTELRQVFADVVSAGIAKGMSEGLKYGVEHGKDNLDLEAIEAYEPKADTKYVAALHALRDL